MLHVYGLMVGAFFTMQEDKLQKKEFSENIQG